MKTLKYFAISLLAAAGSSCAKQVSLEDASPKMSVTFNVLNEGTKSFLGAANAVKWSEGDAVNIYDDVTGKLAESFTISSNQITANVSEGATKFYSLYPYDSNSEFAENKITTRLPALQAAKPGSFANGANISVAYTEISNPSLSYANLGSLVKFTLNEDNVQSVKFLGRNGEAVAGKVKIDYNGGNPTYELVSAATEVELANSDKSALTNGATYYLVVLPQTFANGISVILTKTDGTFATKSSSASVTFARSEITNLGSISGLTFTKDRYALYQAGQVLSIGGVKFSRAANGDAVIVKSSEHANIVAPISNHSGVYFLDDDANTGFNMEAGKTLVSTGHIAILGRYSDRLVRLTPASKSVINITKGTFALSGLEFELSAIGAKLSQNTTDPNADIDNIIFENCSFKAISNPIFNTAPDRKGAIFNIAFNRCKFFPVAKTNFVAYNASTSLHKLRNFVFTNNIVCSAAPMQIGSLIHYKEDKVDYSASEYSSVVWETKVNASHNIFYNVLANFGYIHLYSVKKEQDACVMKYDVFAASESTTHGGSCFALYDKGLDMTETGKFVRVRDGVFDKTFLSKFKPSANGKTYYTSGETAAFKKMKDLAGNPSTAFANADPATGTFVMTDAYKNFGPQE